MNPIWTHFCSHKMEDWLSWLRTVHINSYLELTERFIATHPYFVPSETHFDDTQNQLFQKLIVDWDFINSLSDKGLGELTILTDFTHTCILCIHSNKSFKEDDN